MNTLRYPVWQAAAVWLALASLASASPIILDHYTRTGTSETLNVPFTWVAAPTSNTYSGLVEVHVSGTGNSLYGNINDAFHGSSGAPFDSQFYQLNLGWSTAPLTPGLGEPGNITNFIVFVDGAGATVPPHTPAYSANHIYHFVVDTGLLSGQQLQFGVADGDYGDNGGQYTISVWQLRAGASNAVPDSPAPYAALALSGLMAVSAVRRRLKSRA